MAVKPIKFDILFRRLRSLNDFASLLDIHFYVVLDLRYIYLYSSASMSGAYVYRTSDEFKFLNYLCLLERRIKSILL